MPARPKTLGQITRGKTALNRLRQVDLYITLQWPFVLTSVPSPFIVDVGYGAQAWTALEMLDRWQPLNPHLRLLGLEIDPQRVQTALPYAIPNRIAFQLGGFNVQDVLGGQQAHLIRAYNVLRQYDESAVTSALETMGQGLALGGILIEGTSTPSGGITVFDIYQQTSQGLQHRELVFASNLRATPQVADFQAILPKRLIHHAQDAPLSDFLLQWERTLRLAYAQGYRHPRRLWVESGRALQAQFGYPVDVRKRILGRGYLVVKTSLTPIANPLHL